MAFEGMKVEAPDCDYGGVLKSIEAVDAYTVVFTTCVPDPGFPAKAAFSAFQIQSSDYLEATGGGGDLVSAPVGTGPYKLESWNRGESVVLSRFDDYWGEPAGSPTVVFRWSAEGAQKLIELQAGTVDGIDNVAPDDIPTVLADPALQLTPREAFNIFYVGMNNTYAPFDNEQVRQAVAMAIDRQRIVDNFYPAGSSAADQFLPLGLLARDNTAVGVAFDPVAAKALLAEAGFPNGFTTTLKYRNVIRGYLPEAGAGGPGHRLAAAGEPGADHRDRRDGVRARSSTPPTPASWKAFTCWAGRATIPTPPTSTTSTSAPGPPISSGPSGTTSPPGWRKQPRWEMRRPGAPSTPR